MFSVKCNIFTCVISVCIKLNINHHLKLVYLNDKISLKLFTNNDKEEINV